MDGEKNTHESETAQKLGEIASRRGLNAATGGAWNKVRNAPIIGNAARKGEQALGNKLANNKLGRKLLNQGGFAKPSSKPLGDNNNPAAPTNNSGDIGQNKLQNSLANKSKNLRDILGRKKKKKEKNSTQSEDSGSNNSISDLSGESVEDLKAKIKRKIIIKVAIIGILAFGFYVIIVTIAAIVSGGNLSMGIPINASLSYDTEEFESVNDKDTDGYKDEVNYYKKLKEIASTYDKSHTDKLKVNYLNAIMLQLFYEPEYEIEDEDLREKLEISGGINYAEMTEYVKKIFDEIKPSSGTIDYSLEGNLLSNLKNSLSFKEYYRQILKNKKIDDVIADIHELAQEIESVEEDDEKVITEETKVVLPTPVSTQTPTGTSASTSSISMTDYLVNAIYANTSSNDLKNDEAVKAYTVLYSTNVVANSNLTINASSAVVPDTLVCSPKKGCSYVNDNGKMVLKDGPGEKNEFNVIFYNGAYYYKQPLSNSEVDRLEKDVKAVYGNVLVSGSGTYSNVSFDNLNTSYSTYTDILKNNYDSYTVKNIGENTYASGVNYGLLKILTPVVFYDQNDYPNVNFCGKKKETIKSSGCGVTSMAIIVSTYENDKKYDPVAMMKDAKGYGSCGNGISGTATSFFKKEANKMKYKYLHVGKKKTSDLNLVLSHLAQNHLIVVHVGPGRFTRGGHYMVLGGVDPETKSVYVYDPYNKVNKNKSVKSGSGWYNFNDIIAKEAYGFYIIWKD